MDSLAVGLWTAFDFHITRPNSGEINGRIDDVASLGKDQSTGNLAFYSSGSAEKRHGRVDRPGIIGNTVTLCTEIFYVRDIGSAFVRRAREVVSRNLSCYVDLRGSCKGRKK